MQQQQALVAPMALSRLAGARLRVRTCVLRRCFASAATPAFNYTARPLAHLRP